MAIEHNTVVESTWKKLLQIGGVEVAVSCEDCAAGGEPVTFSQIRSTAQYFVLIPTIWTAILLRSRVKSHDERRGEGRRR